MSKLRATKQPKVYFVFAPMYERTGSTVMRGYQLSEIAKRYLPKSYQIEYVSFSTSIKNSIIFLTKGAIYTATTDELIKLKEYKNILLFDLVDAPPPADKLHYADAVIACSRTALKSYSQTFPQKKICLIDHHVDPRISKHYYSAREQKVKVAYFGDPANTYLSSKIKDIVDVYPVVFDTPRNRWLDNLASYPLHYAIRNEDNERFKPFLKGFTAAHVGANILVQANQAEALHWLGEDYPYLLKEKVSEENILKALDFIRASYGSAEWRKALEVMKKIKEQTTESVVGKQLKDTILYYA